MSELEPGTIIRSKKNPLHKAVFVKPMETLRTYGYIEPLPPYDNEHEPLGVTMAMLLGQPVTVRSRSVLLDDWEIDE